ncbi:peroxidase N1-like [Daucus carota subsp. sativus]|uniref:peroxidase N1-like n=1 Tax=Daucus carota subsp. sativus TaxID=79200 RepID=UPI0007EF0115|nr:PREDICTED: peroxidase N1-like isoform X1 [Daucus carota subsp. sativus]
MDSFLNKFSVLVLLLLVTPLALAQTRVGFYSKSCPRAESIVQATVKKHVKSNSAVAPGLLRMVFHDCFVHGCDASILINGSNAERTARPNLLLRGYDVIDDAKTQLEAACPGVVSCADILALAARDATVEVGALTYRVPTGRRDGRVSLASDTSNLPSFTDSVTVQRKKFSDVGLSAQDLVTLVGGHTIGTVACQFVSYRLYNFKNTSGADPTINSKFLPTLQSLCPQNGDGNKRIPLDYGSGDNFDHSFFKNVRDGRGILESDQSLWQDGTTKNYAQRFMGIRGLAGLTLNVEFGKAMIKMTNVGVKTGSAGEIRKICSAIN